MHQPFLHLERSAKLSPHTIAISTLDTDLTFAEFYDNAVRFAAILRQRGIRPGDKVGTLLPPILDLIISEALFHEACVGAQIPSDYPAIVGRVFDWIVVHELYDGFDLEKQIVIDTEFLREAAVVVAVANPHDYGSKDALCRLSFSSGTTGEPKAIPVSIDCMEDRAIERTRQWMPVQPYLCLLGLSTGLTFMSFYAHIAAGETFVLAGIDAGILTQIERHGIRCVMGSPHQLSVLLAESKHRPGDAPDVPIVMSAGSALPDALVRRLETRFGSRVLATYASTEAGSVAIREGIGAADGLAGTILDDVDVRILDEQFNDVPDGEIGLIAIKRARQPQTYLDDSAASARNFRDGYFIPGDLGYRLGNDLYLSGRVSEVLNVGGIKADPARIEGIAREFDGVADAAAFGLRHTDGTDEMCLAFVSSTAIDVRAFAQFMTAILHESTPTKYFRTASIERNHMGKVNRDSLSEQFSRIAAEQGQ